MTNEAVRTLGENLWEVNTPIRVAGIPMRHRMTVIRLHDGRLVLHSPAQLNDIVRRDVEELGDIAAIIAPSWWHDLWLGEWRSAYPETPMYAAPALIKSSSLSMLPLEENVHPWGTELQFTQLHGLGFGLDEFDFYHPASASLIVADLLLSPGEEDEPLTRTVGRIFVGLSAGCHFPRVFRLAVRNRHAFRDSLQRIAEWNFDRIIVGHGDVVKTDGKRVFLQAFRWLGLTESF